MNKRHRKPAWEEEPRSFPYVENIGTAFSFNNMTEAHTVFKKKTR